MAYSQTKSPRDRGKGNMKRVIESLVNAQGWAQEACRLLRESGAKRQAAAVQKALRLLRKAEADLLCLLVQKEEMVNLLSTPGNPEEGRRRNEEL
jgi:hypothetical protein